MSQQEHKVEIRPFPGRVRVMTAGYMIAETENALELSETGYRAVYYIPKPDIRMDMFRPSATTTLCPHKGTANYWTIHAGNQLIEDAAWSYEVPLAAVSEIAGYLAFSPERIDAIESTTTGTA